MHTCSASIPSIPRARPWFPHPQTGDHQAEPQCPVAPPDTNRAGTQGCLFQYQPWACTGPTQTLILVALPDGSGSVWLSPGSQQKECSVLFELLTTQTVRKRLSLPVYLHGCSRGEFRNPLEGRTFDHVASRSSRFVTALHVHVYSCETRGEI